MEKERQVIPSLDVSTIKTGYAIYHNGKLVNHGVITAKHKDWVDRVMSMCTTVRAIDLSWGITHLVIEDTYVSKNVNTVKKLCLAQGMFIATLSDAELIQVYPVQWKAHYGLTKKNNKRELQKQTSISIAETLTLLTITNDDEADAILMGRYIVNKLKEDKDE